MKTFQHDILLVLFVLVIFCEASQADPLLGDWIDYPFEIQSIPTFVTGNTCDFADDIGFSCPYTSPAPDVVYRYTADQDGLLVIDLCGSGYDTQTFVTSESLALIGCNDDFYGGDCGNYVSNLDRVPVEAGSTYYIFVDGYINACGDYELAIFYRGECDVDQSTATVFEGEEGVGYGYIDIYTAGCFNDSGTELFMPLPGNESGSAILAGSSGWIAEAHGDGDWFVAVSTGAEVGVTLFCAEPMWFVATQLAECQYSSSWVPVFVPACESSSFSTPVDAPGATVWFGLWPVDNWPPVGYSGWQFDYLMEVDGIASDIVSVELTTWSGVKDLFR